MSIQKLPQKDLLVLAVGAVLSGVSAVVGVAHLAWPWLFAIGGAITAIATLITRAIEQRKLKERIRTLWFALAVALTIPIGSFAYHVWWDPSNTQVESSQVVVDGSDVDSLRTFDAPGDAQQGFDYPPVIGNSTVTIDCYVTLAGKGEWLHVAGSGGWLPLSWVHPVPGVPFSNPQHC